MTLVFLCEGQPASTSVTSKQTNQRHQRKIGDAGDAGKKICPAFGTGELALKICSKTLFLAQKRTILYYNGLCGGGICHFLFRENFNIPLDPIPIRIGPVRCIFFQKSLKSFFGTHEI